MMSEIEGEVSPETPYDEGEISYFIPVGMVYTRSISVEYYENEVKPEVQGEVKPKKETAYKSSSRIVNKPKTTVKKRTLPNPLNPPPKKYDFDSLQIDK